MTGVQTCALPICFPVTIHLKGNEYSQVKERLKLFRKDNVNGLIETKPTISGEHIIFTARILKDKSNPNSAEATGHSMGEHKDNKAFEKLETIAVGRALALLGYSADGEIASSEEMEEFEKYKQQRLKEVISEAKAKLEKAKDIDSLGKIWASLSVEAKKELEEYKILS